MSTDTWLGPTPLKRVEQRPSTGHRSADYELYFAHQRTIQTVHGVVITYRLALNGPAATVVHSELDQDLPPLSVRIRAGGYELLIDSADWIDRRAELDAHVRAWMLEHIDLRAARPRTAARRYDEQWMQAWRDANPGRR